MKTFALILVLAAAGLGVWAIYSTWEEVKEKDRPAAPAPAPAPPPAQLQGLPPGLDTSLQAAQRRGASGLRDWLRMYRRTVADPRLASIELDYVVLVAREDIAEARKVFAQVKQRTPPASLVYPRIKQLEKTYD